MGEGLVTVQDVDHVSSGRWIRGDGQDLGDPIGEDLVRRCQMQACLGRSVMETSTGWGTSWCTSWMVGGGKFERRHTNGCHST